MKPFKTSLLLLISLLFGGLMILSSCEEDTVTKTVEVVVHDTVLVSIISVDDVYATPDSVDEGGSVTLTADISSGPEAGSLTYTWVAPEGGTFNKSQGDTVVWTAPEEAGAYLVTVLVTDNEFSAVGSKRIGVGMYAPTASPYYLGDAACAGCHASTHTAWEETAHGHAWATLQNSGHPASYCNPCHTVGFVGDLGNGGYDEAPIAKYVNVQCENCHGPASEHVGSGTPDPTKISISYAVETCAVCHEGSHHPYYTDWATSVHAAAPESHAAESGNCGGCHEGVAGAIRLSGDLSTWYSSGPTPDRPSFEELPAEAIACATCHDPHNDDVPGQLRTMADVPLGPSNGTDPIITEGGTGKLCMHCHHARHTGDEHIPAGDNRFGPHYSGQADMAAGATGNHSVAAPGFVWADPSHIKVQNSCKTCHLNMIEYVSESEPAYTGHSFEPTVEACKNCHGEISAFTDIMALEDFDGDGTVEGLQNEVSGLIHVVDSELEHVAAQALLAKGIDTTGFYGSLFRKDQVYYAYNADTVAVDSLVVPVEWREVGWNIKFVEEDGSLGIHNPDYAVQLLQQSYKYLTGNDVPRAAIVSNGKTNAVADIQVIQ
ncbi:MAG: hypothetical protein H6627_06780 [Calditrichae bacterium]|nr:hypothetical protein [Calditrichia bacterium]